MRTAESTALMEVRDLCVQFGRGARPARAVDGVSFSLRAGETLALVGESGSGKSVTAMALGRLVPEPPGRYARGSVLFEGEDVLAMSDEHLRKLRGGRLAYIFQEPATSLNPVLRAGHQIEEALRLHRPEVDAERETRDLLARVGLPDPAKAMRSYPHELSGGMQQRVMIAMALASQPSLLVADEPTTALDVTVQAQILRLLSQLQAQMGMAVLLITHNLGLVAEVAHRVAVMYAGRIVEEGDVVEVLRRPRHPYTRALLLAVPRLEDGRGSVQGIEGSVPDPRAIPAGCAFHPRCRFARERCRTDEPAVETIDGRSCRCHFWREIA